MFATPNAADARRPGGARRSLGLSVGASSSRSTNYHQQNNADAESPVPENNENGN